MSFCVCDSICPQSHLCDIPQSLFATSLSSCFPCLFVCCSKFHQLSRLFAIPLSSFFSPPLFCVCYSVCLPPPPVMYGFTPCTPPSCFQVFPLTYCTSVIILFSNSPTCIIPPPPSIPQPRLLSSLPPLFCVYDSICHPPPPVCLPSLYNSALSLLLSPSSILCLLLL